MLRRFYSKKSGFTLVEIIIAFAIFAIMASMIAQILQLSVSARQYNIKYQAELAEQERLLTLIKKEQKDYKNSEGNIAFEIGGVKVDLPYDILSTVPGSVTGYEGLNYYVANVNYKATGSSASSTPSNPGSGASSGSVMSRFDTRITGTRGIGYIYILQVVKDTHEYDNNDPFKLAKGHSRYFIKCFASDTNLKGKTTLANEDIPFEQYRLYFFNDEKLASSKGGTDSNGTYTNMAPTAANIVDMGYLDVTSAEFSKLVDDGLSNGKISSGTTGNNRYKIDQMGTNCVRIGSPLVAQNRNDMATGVNPGINGNGDSFKANEYSQFYVEFDEDITLTTGSFGHNGVEQIVGSTSVGHIYEACPVYLEKYNDDGTPIYPNDESELKKLDKHVNIYGANLFTRKYGG